MSDTVYVTSTVNGTVGFSMPELRFKRVWQKKKAKFPVPKDVLREAIFNPGVSYLFEKGILYIDDLEFKKEIGLEPYDAEKETIILLEDKYIERLLGVMPIQEFKIEFGKLTIEQQKEVAGYAVEHNMIDMSKAEHMKKICGVDVIKMYSIKKQNEEILPNEISNDSLPKGF
jgi:hypothetical protein